MKISLCMITGDDPRAIDAISSVRDLVDEVILVYTGKRPLLEIQAGMAILKNYKVDVLLFPWIDDFSAARNYSFKQATGDWIFWMDSDDTINDTGELRKKFLKLIEEQPDVQCVLLPYEYAYDEQGVPTTVLYRERFLRRDCNPHWIYPIHECVEIALLKQASIEHPVCHHKTAQDSAQNSERNLRIFEENLEKEKYAKDGRFWFYYGNALQAMGRFKRAVLAYTEALFCGLWTDDAYAASFCIAESHFYLQEYELALKCLTDMTADKEYDKFSSHKLMLGILYHIANYPDLAKQWLQKAIRPVPKTPGKVSPDHYRKDPLVWLGKVGAKAGDADLLSSLPAISSNKAFQLRVVFQGQYGSDMPQDRLRRENVTRELMKLWPSADLVVTLDVGVGEVSPDVFVLTRYMELDEATEENLKTFRGLLIVDACEDIFDFLGSDGLEATKAVIDLADIVVASSRRLKERIESVFSPCADNKTIVIPDMWEERK